MMTNIKDPFDPQQRQVLDCQSPRLLVSAGAGSGKTTVMIQKIVDLLLSNKASCDDLLVVTFTNLASVEMRDKLVKSLTKYLINATDEEEKNRIQNLLDGVQTASVDTIDGFCSKMLKKYFYQTETDPEIKIISSFSQEYYINKALDMAISAYHSTNENELIILCDIFEKQNRSLNNLKQNLLRAFNYCICQKDYDAFLDKILLEYKDFSTPSSQYLNNYLVSRIYTDLNSILKLLPPLSNFKKLHDMVDAYACHLININGSNNLLQNLNIVATCPVVDLRNIETIKDNDDYEKLKYHLANIRSLLQKYESVSTININNLEKISSHLQYFVDLLKLFINTYSSLKQQNNVMDFSDLERKMLILLQNPEILNEFHSTYKYIFVDEYQDINPMQDELINTLLSKSSNLFLVGDVKQSIYGFRQSTPELFIQTYKDYKQNPQKGSAFDMKINFRSAPQILEFNNEIFCHLMTEKDADIDYAKTSQFDPRNLTFPTTQAVEILVADSDIKQRPEIVKGLYSINQHVNPINNFSSHELETRVVVNKIKQLVGSEFYDASTGVNRPIEYRDIAILCRSIGGDKVQNLSQTLTKCNVPINISKRSVLKQSEGVNKILSILKIINHTASDIDYTYLFTSPLINLSYEELTKIYSDHSICLYDNLQKYALENNDDLSIKIKYGFNLCEEFRIISSTLNTIDLIKTILNKYHLRQHLIACEKGHEQLDILDEFLNSLSSEENSLSISKFIDLIENNLESNNDIISRDSVNSVTIQTIHASKGLEYPIVILFDCGHQFTFITEHNDLDFDLDFGVGMQYYDLNNRTRQDSPTKLAILLKSKEKAFKEELRLLYVATTRAKNKLIITGCCSKSKIRNNTLSRNNYISLILSAYYSKLNTNTLTDTYNFKNCHIELIDEMPEIELNASNNDNVLTFDTVIKNNLNFTYPHIQETNISIKNNVTAISKTLNDEYNINPIKLNLDENLQATLDDLAEIGTKYHNVLSTIDYSQPYIQQEVEENIDPELIKLAYQKISPLASNCTNQYSEKQFMMYIPYNEIFIDSPVTTKILVQGVIDLILEFDDHIILIDYKYSNLPINRLVNKYATQLRLYQIALERAFKKPVTSAYIYSIKTGDLS